MNQFIRYLKFKKKELILALICVAIFAVTFGLYGLPMGAVIYPAALCIIIGAVFLIMDYSSALRTHEALEYLKKVRPEIMHGLPAEVCFTDGDYQEIVELLKAEYFSAEEATDRRYTEMIDYYTTWVHQIKTPIAAMRLRLQSDDSAFSRQLQMELNRIEQYVEMVMTYLRLDSESTDYVFRETELDEIIRTSVRRFSGEFIGRKIRLEYEPVSVKVLTDEKWLGFVLEQVLSNALKYTSEGSISIYMEEPKTLCIRDTGIGIAPEDLPRIFERGFTGFNGRADRKASGIGLYLCRRILNNLGHSISAESEVSARTTIRIDLNTEKVEIE